MTDHKSPTAGMSIDILSFKPKNRTYLLEEFPVLNEIKEVKDYLSVKDKNGNRKRVIQYIILLYSEDSILNKKPTIELKERKLKCAQMVGLPTKPTGEFNDEVVRNLFDLKSEEIINIILSFLRFQGKSIWTEIVATENMVDQYIKGMFQIVDMDDDKKALEALNIKSKLRQEVRNMNQDLKGMYKDFYKDHEDIREKGRTVGRKDSIESRVISNA